MGGGKGDAPAAPDYTPVAQSSVEAAKIQAQTSQDQLDWAKQQYADQAPQTQKFMSAMTGQTDAQTANAAADRQRYQSIYQPTEDKFVQEANNWNSPDRAAQASGAAMADVATQMGAARNAATANLESFGIDPSQTRYAALDLGSRVQQAASQAAAGTQSRLNTEATGLALQGEAINIGKGYPGQIAQSYAGATTAGQSGITAGLNTSSTYGNLMGTATQWGGLSNNSNGMAVNALNTGFNNQLGSAQLKEQQSQNFASGLGSMIGGGLAVAKLAGGF